MRILIPCHEFPPIGGGAAAVCAALAREYSARGHEVTVFTMGFRDLPAREETSGRTIVRAACGRRQRELSTAWEGWRWARRSWPEILRLQRQRPFDVVHAHFIMPGGLVGSWLKAAAGVPFIITAHGTDVPGYNRERMRWIHTAIRPWWRSVCASADCVISPSSSLRRLIDAAARGHRVEVIPNGLATQRFPPLVKKPRILLCGRFVERKGIHTYLEAIRDLELPGWQVDIVGEGPLAARIQQLAGQCRAGVHLHGWIDNDDPRLAALYGQASVFTFPSEWENLPIALLEAMSAGCAVVATDAGGNREALGDAGCLVPVSDLGALHRITQELTADRERCRVLGVQARARVIAHFEWRQIAGRYLELLHSLAERRADRCASA